MQRLRVLGRFGMQLGIPHIDGQITSVTCELACDRLDQFDTVLSSIRLVLRHTGEAISLCGAANAALAKLRGCWPLPVRAGGQWRMAVPLMLPWQLLAMTFGAPWLSGALVLSGADPLDHAPYSITVAYKPVAPVPAPVPALQQVLLTHETLYDRADGPRYMLNFSHPTSALLLFLDAAVDFDRVVLLCEELPLQCWTYAEAKRDGFFLLSLSEHYLDSRVATTLNLSRIHTIALDFGRPLHARDLRIVGLHFLPFREGCFAFGR